MELKIIIYLIPLLTLFSCGGQTNNTNDSTLDRTVSHHHNKIDEIQTAKEIEVLISSTDEQYNEFRVNDTLNYSNKIGFGFSSSECLHLSDSLKVKPWTKIDFDNNGYTDLLVVGYWVDPSIICIMDSGKNKFYIKRITKRSFQDCTFSIVKTVHQAPAVIYYSLSESDWIHKKEKHLIADTLVFQFGDFIEFNNFPATHDINKIEYSTGPCFGECPIFDLTIYENRTASFIANEFNKKKGEFTSTIDTINYKDLVNLLNYIDFTKLDNYYSVPWTDDQESKLKITYDDGKIKMIKDYGLMGTFGLNRVYVLLFNLRENQEWK
jgi:hypothetical protein